MICSSLFTVVVVGIFCLWVCTFSLKKTPKTQSSNLSIQIPVFSVLSSHHVILCNVAVPGKNNLSISSYLFD